MNFFYLKLASFGIDTMLNLSILFERMIQVLDQKENIMKILKN